MREPVRQDLFNGLLLFLKDEQVYQMTNVSNLVFNFFTTDDTPTTISILKTLDNLKSKKFIEAELREDGTTSITPVNKQGQDFIESRGWTLNRYYVWAAITPDEKQFLKTTSTNPQFIYNDHSKNINAPYSAITESGAVTFTDLGSVKINEPIIKEKPEWWTLAFWKEKTIDVVAKAGIKEFIFGGTLIGLLSWLGFHFSTDKKLDKSSPTQADEREFEPSSIQSKTDTSALYNKNSELNHDTVKTK